MPKSEINNKTLHHNFKLVKTEKIEELIFSASKSKNPKCSAYEMQHKSGTKLLYLENDDPEMSFTIGFKTLPCDSTGVFHILEHSVLCGSRKFPVKEPFTNLLKSSMQTFLNAMTFPDKTIYPVASKNEKDLYNLIDVYMDAVLYPNIYINKNIFYQEGGHITPDGFSGVVYNEMQGVYSDPQEHIFEGLMKSLFPDSCYAYSSGGNPKTIKTLTYEKYLEQHNTNYNLNNAYIILYGDLDIHKMLEYLDAEYLSQDNELCKWRNNIKTCVQGKFENNFEYADNQKPYKVELETNKENAECGAGFVFKRDHKKIIATKILIDALCSSNESPLKKSLLKENFAADIDFDLLVEVYQPFIILECKGNKKNYSDKLIETVQNKISEILNNGIPEHLLNAAISSNEFKLKEKIPECTNGIDSSIAVLSEWLYDEKASTEAIKYLDDLSWLKEMAKTNYFEDLAKEIFIDNKHVAAVEVIPIENKPKENTNNPLVTEETIKLNEELKNWQTTPDNIENENKIPTMKKSDIGKIVDYPKWTVLNENCKTLYYDIFTNGITYFNRYYPLNGLGTEDLFYLSILCLLLGKLDTQNYLSSEIDVIWQEKLGSLSFTTAAFENASDIYDLDFRLCVKGASLNQNVDHLAWFVDEIIHRTKFEDTKKIETILKQKKVAMEQNFIACGHSCAISYAASGILPVYQANELSNGVYFYKKLKTLLADFENNKNQLTDKLQEISNAVFQNLPTISFAGENIIKNIDFKHAKTNEADFNFRYKTENNKTAVLIPSNVNYCACVNDARIKNLNITGPNIVASKIIALDYLWNEVRVKNGAYGAGMLVNARGSVQYYSYRDPESQKTYLNFTKSTEWLNKLNIESNKLDNYIISTIAKFDAPVPTRNLIAISDNYYFSKLDPNTRQEIADEILETKHEDLKAAAKIFESLNKDASLCVFGGNDIKQLEQQGFNIIDLFNE